ncbi:MAG: hypothetical protein NC388_08070 [Clostridium sp.]|nr:hypothetical protein [Clostridium sp.]
MKKVTLFVYALAGGLLWGGLSVKAQQRIQMTTSRSAGTQLTFSLNKNATVTVDWGNGTPVECTADKDGLISGTLAGETVVIDGVFSMLDCSDCSLTAIVTKDAPGLTVLNCSNNQLTALALSSNKAISSLDCGNNQIATLSAPRGSAMTYLDCSQNKLKTLVLTNMTSLETLICSDNEMSALNPSNAPTLKTVWCDNNVIKSLNMTGVTAESVVCYDNSGLSTYTTSTSASKALVDFWANNTSLRKLDLTGAAKLQTLECSNVGLTELALTQPEKALLCCYLNDNNLTFNHLYATSFVSGNYTNANQGPFALYDSKRNEVTKIQVGEGVTFDAMHPVGDSKTTTSYSWYTADGQTKLASGTNKDYVRTSSTNTFTFKKPFESIYCSVTNAAVKGLTLKSTPLKVYAEGMSIAQVMQEKGFRFSTENDAILMNAEEDVTVNIFTVDGKKVWNGTVGQHGVRVPLKGNAVYLVNGIKVKL